MPALVSAAGMVEHFSGKTITIIVGFSPGGGYDTFARLVAKHSARHFPGKPELILVQNLPGSGGERGLRAAIRAKRDGYTIGMVHPRFVKRELQGTDVPDFDLDTIKIVGTPNNSPRTQALYVKRSLAADWNGVKALGRKITAGATEPGSVTTVGAEFLSLIGGPVKMVFGYGSSAESLAAFGRGELDANAYASYEFVPRLYPEWIEQKLIVPVVWWGTPPGEDKRFMNWLGQLGAPVPPSVLDVAGATADQRAVFNLAADVNRLWYRAFVISPDVPDEIVRSWQAILKKTVEDPDFIAAADKAGFAVGYGGPAALRAVLPSGRRALQDAENRKLFGELAGKR
jgi:tripartite-type tricarboxylate transporter receptor subunit TctC